MNATTWRMPCHTWRWIASNAFLFSLRKFEPHIWKFGHDLRWSRAVKQTKKTSAAWAMFCMRGGNVRLAAGRAMLIEAGGRMHDVIASGESCSEAGAHLYRCGCTRYRCVLGYDRVFECCPFDLRRFRNNSARYRLIFL